MTTAGAALWASGQFPAHRWTRRLNLGVLGALLGGAGMTANYYMMSGATLPGLNPANAFNEGLSIDGLLTLVAVGLGVIHVLPPAPARGRPRRVGVCGSDRGARSNATGRPGVASRATPTCPHRLCRDSRPPTEDDA